MFHRFDITPSVAIIGPADELVKVLEALRSTFYTAYIHHEEYQLWVYCDIEQRMIEKLTEKISAIYSGEILHSPEETGRKKVPNE